MKSSISHIISFTLMVIINILILFVVVELSLKNNTTLNILNKTNYYDDAYQNITDKISKYIVNEDIKNDYINYINKNIIRNDIKNIISNNEYKINYYYEFYIIISGYSKDEAIRDKYASDINKIYVSNIFPIKEYKLLDKIRISNENIIIYSLILGIIILLLEFILFAINKNLNYNRLSHISSLILICFPFIFINTMHLFTNFIYTNSYYTNYLIGIVNNIKNILFILGISLLFTISVIKSVINIKKNVK